jgi:hypothetical protein
MINLNQAIETFRLDIARLDYSGPRYITDKQAIAETLNVKVFSDQCAAIEDPHNGTVWVVYFDQNKWRYSRV